MQTNQMMPQSVTAAIAAALPEVAADTIHAVQTQVPGYLDLPDEDRARLASSVRLALEVFLASAVTPGGAETAPAIEGAYLLGRIEAREGRALDALLSAFRVGARFAWQGIASVAAEAGLPAARIVDYAAELFGYVDALSASSVSGYADELATQGRARERQLEHLVEMLLNEAGDVDAAALRAGWEPPATLAAVLLPADQADRVHTRLGRRALRPGGDVVGLPPETALLLMPAAQLRGLNVSNEALTVLGPDRPWRQAASSFRRAVRAWGHLAAQGSTGVREADSVLVEMVIGADSEALADLRARVLQPLDGLPEGTRSRLEETLRAWLLLRGRRAEVAGALFIHQQTVRYRMAQIRELYGEEALDDQRRVLELVVALA